jgi:hypothetical protein
VRYLYISENTSLPLLDDENVMEQFTLQGQRLPLKVALAESEPSREAEQSVRTTSTEFLGPSIRWLWLLRSVGESCEKY